jgi:hypothetical protein
MSGVSLSFSAVLIADAGTSNRTTYQWARLADASDPQLWGLGIAVAVALILAIVIWLYRRDTAELHKGLRLVLLALRCVALAGLVVYFLQLEKRTAQEIVVDGQVVVLADVSQSMGLADSGDSAGAVGPSRSERLAEALAESPLLGNLRERNDVVIARFDEQVDRVASLKRSERADQVPTPGEDASEPRADIDWVDVLRPRGTATAVGDALRAELELHREAPLAGIVLVSDGGENTGFDAEAAAKVAGEARVPVFTIGVGSTRPPQSLAVGDIVAPRRAFPGDAITLTATLRSSGFDGQVAQVELLRREASDRSAAPTGVDSQRVALAEGGEPAPIRFQFEPTEVGRYVYEVAVSSLPGDADPRDNRRDVEIDVVDERTRVLLVSGGPARDYRFLRTLLDRDPTVEVDVWLQSAPPGISQEADRILTEFPSDKAALFEYDVIVAIDPNWLEIDAADVEVLQSWVGDEAGGMIVIAGPVHTADWVRSTEHRALRALYPVEFQQRLTLLDDGQYSGETAWPLDMERAGREAEFLWLKDISAESEAAWASFPGVFGYYAVRGAKPGATVYARFGDPQAAMGDSQPVYMAGHFYGAGQVFYVGSSEFWRLRMVDPVYFDTLWIKLIRHVSQGRLLRGSSRGAILVERDRYELAEPVTVRARLTDQRHDPLVTPEVSAQVLWPDGRATPLRLAADVGQPGMYLGQFYAMQEGAYEIAVAVPDQADEQLTRRIQVRIPDRERLNPVRNERLLSQLATVTGGVYYSDFDAAIQGRADLQPLPSLVPDRTETRIIEGSADEDFARHHRQWLLAIVCGALLTEWTIRRLCQLA